MPSRFEVDDGLWAEVEPLLPVITRRRRYPGRRRLDNRAALNGILLVLHTGIAWRDLPQELGYGSGVTCWRRLREWQQAEVWERLHRVLLKRLRCWNDLASSPPALDQDVFARLVRWAGATIERHSRSFLTRGRLHGAASLLVVSAREGEYCG